MNCQSFEIVVRDLAHGQASARMTSELRAATAHVEKCRACEMKLRDERELSRNLATIASADNEPSSFIEAGLLQAFRQTRTDFQKAALVNSRVSFRRSAWFAAAAALLLVFGLVVLRTRVAPPKTLAIMPVVPTREDPTRAENPAVKTFSTAGSSDSERNLIPRQGRRVNHRSVKRTRIDSAQQVATVPVPSAEPEIATQFIALSSVDPMNLMDGGQIVRVELSRLAMASFGLPVNMDRSGERVKADVLLSADGFARAIRFIQ